MIRTSLDFHSGIMSSDGGTLADLANEITQDTALPSAHVMLREALQNSCDQRLYESEPIDFYVDVFSLKGSKASYLKTLLTNANSEVDPIGFSQILKQDEIEILAFADSNTKGLGGPTDASMSDYGNFVDFFFVFGRSEDKGRISDGGSRGSGRITLNNASSCSSVLVYSQFKNKNDQIECRLMGLANAKSFSSGGKRYTGRHWWGNYEDGRIQPIEGDEAKLIASQLGMDCYLGDKTGFVAFVIGNSYVLGENNKNRDTFSRDQLLQSLREAAYLYGWPHMLASPKEPSVNFHFRTNGIEEEFVDPSHYSHLHLFVKAFKALDDDKVKVSGKEDIFFRGLGRKTISGKLTWINSPATELDVNVSQSDEIPLASIALIRRAKFVVKYFPVSQQAEGIATRGVFMVDPSQEENFRKSEPVAHDDWIPSRIQVSKGAKNPVKQAKEQILNFFKPMFSSNSDSSTGSASVILGNIGGSILEGLELIGPPKPPKPSKGGGTQRPLKGLSVLEIGSPKIVTSELSSYTSSFKFQILFTPPYKPGLRIAFKSKTIIEGGTAEAVPPIGAKVPQIVGINLDGITVKSLNEPFDVSEEDHFKIVEVLVKSEQGTASTCQPEVIGN